MKKAKILSGVLLLCFSSPLISQAATLDVRGGYLDWPPESPDNQYHLNK
ncbi:hypothetical protein GQL87_22745 [Escherichia coli]|nr:hypothetical protein [Escherichia coli]